MVFNPVNQPAHQQVLQALGKNRAVRLIHACSALEIPMPLRTYEFARKLIDILGVDRLT